MRPKFNIYTSSDQHFNHWNINEYCNRGFKDLKDMNETLIQNWNQTVKKEDIIILLGDLIFTKGESKAIVDILKRLNGRKMLVVGNHDRKSYSWYLSNGIDFLAERFIWRFNKKKILFIHDPKSISYRDYRTCDVILHGHRHDKGQFVSKRKQCRIVNLSVEKTNYKPLNLITLLNRLQQGYYDKKNS